jgi:uncharacterized protein
VKFARSFILVSVVVATGVGCFRESPTPVAPPPPKPAASSPQEERLGPLPTIQVSIGTKTFTLEVADTTPERTQGLMYRTSMPANHGMLFVFAQEEWLGFWMKNTEIPLDIIYLNKDRRVVSIHQMAPRDLTSTFAAAPSKYAIELNLNTARTLNLKLGDTIVLPADLKGE